MNSQPLFDFGEEEKSEITPPQQFTILDQIIRDKRALLDPTLSDEDFEFISTRVEMYMADYKAGQR